MDDPKAPSAQILHEIPAIVSLLKPYHVDLLKGAILKGRPFKIITFVPM